VLNHDDPSCEYFRRVSGHDHALSYSAAGDRSADMWAAGAVATPAATRFTGHSAAGSLAFETRLVGLFNVANILAAAGAAAALGVSPEAIRRGAAETPAVPGRMERIDEGQDFLALVDFAHTPNALRRALEAARPLVGAGGRVIAAFGSAGLRDREKRRLMAEVSAELADLTVLTAEDPRTESLDGILDEMAAGCAAKGGVEGETFWRVPDRGEALAFACRLAQPGDVVMACGKGHEQSMCFGAVEYPWDDREALRAALRGTPLKTLPTAET
jgi:UDP-N-acetylmuramoyl-L-alanyl-D-glutamate--2,6-diaminopimelate ligase